MNRCVELRGNFRKGVDLGGSSSGSHQRFRVGTVQPWNLMLVLSIHSVGQECSSKLLTI